MASVGQPNPDIILEERGDIHIQGKRKYKVWSMKLGSKRASHNHYSRFQPRLSLLMYNV